MLLRTIVAFILLPVLFLILFFFPPLVLAIAIAVVSMIAVYELLWSTGFIRNATLVGFSCFVSGLVPIWVYYGSRMLPSLTGIFIYVFVVFTVGMVMPKRLPFGKISGMFFSTFVVPYFLSTLLLIYNMEYGVYLIVIPFIAAWVTDSAAYFIGTIFGKTKLLPAVSAKKTVEGSIGGIISSVIAELLYGLVLLLFFKIEANLPLLGLCGFIGSFAAQAGDLSMSLVKREFHIKDYGNILPGHGGVLDRFDSVLFVAPAMAIAIQLVTII